jgi:hypothetical protein
VGLRDAAEDRGHFRAEPVDAGDGAVDGLIALFEKPRRVDGLAERPDRARR